MQLNERFAPDRKGRVLCLAAGNEGAKAIHGQASFNPEKPGRIEWEAHGEKPTVMSVYVDGAAPEDVKVEPGDDATKYTTRATFVHNISGSLVSLIEVSKGKGSISLSTKTPNKTLRADAYLPMADEANQGKFIGACATNRYQVLSPGCASNGLTVGSYDFNADFNRKDKGPMTFYGNPFTKERLEVGKLSYYSNVGFLRSHDKIIKPDIVAPGQWHIAPAAEKGDKEVLDPTGKFQAFNGTSAATPYVAGVVALMMERKPDLTVKEVRKLFEKYASKDKFTGDDLPNDHWGYGKLDVKAIKKMLDALR
jgi:subtilisin family serine protease